MATLGSLQDTLQDIGTRLRAENEAHSKDAKNSKLNLDFTRERPGSERRPKPLPLSDIVPGRPKTISARPRERPRIEPFLFEPHRTQDSPEVHARVKEIACKSGLLTIDSKTYKSTIQDMEYIDELGNGTSGNVVKMRHKPSKKVIAVKQMRRSGNPEETKRVFFDLEVVLKSHGCPYIVQCLGCFITDADVWICMELMATCLDKLIKRYKQPIPEPILGKISVATVNALHYLKETHGVIHRDVKPSNILLDEHGNIKLCDFGISGRLVDSKAKTRSAGCAAYMAPERIDPPDPTKPDYDIRADVWSLGITLVELATGQFPYRDCRTDFEVLTKVLQDDPPTLPADKGFSKEFSDFVKDCLNKNHCLRPKYKKLLEFPFIKKYEEKDVDVAAWFAEVSKVTEAKVRSSPKRVSIFSSPHLPRSSRPTSRPSALSEPPPVAPRRRSRTPEAHSHDRVQPAPSQQTISGAAVSGSLGKTPCSRSQLPASPSIARAVSASPSRVAPPASPGPPSRALSSSPLPRGVPHNSQPHSYPGAPSVSNCGIQPTSTHYPPHTSQTFFPLNYSPKPYTQTQNPYSGIYSQVLPPRSLQSSYTHNFYSPYSNSRDTTNTMSSTGRNSSQYFPAPPVNHSAREGGPSSGGLAAASAASSGPGLVRDMAVSWPAPSQPLGSEGTVNCNRGSTGNGEGVTGSNSHMVTRTPPLLRKTPEPVRFNPEPWAPRGRFAQPAHHSRSHSTDLTSHISNSCRYNPAYLPPHVSPLVSRRIVENRAAAAASNQMPSSTAPIPTPHHRYTQEVYYNSRPYYTPEPQRRIFPRLGNP